MIAVLGATGATGDLLMPMLAERFGAANLLAVVRATSQTDKLTAAGIRSHACDITVPDTYVDALRGVDTFIALIGIKTKFFPAMMTALQRAGVRRGIFVGSTQVFSQYHAHNSLYHANEALIRDSGLAYTILRPTMIYGSVRGKNIRKLITYLNRLPIMPMVANGATLLQPVHTEDLCRAIVAAAATPAAENREYVIAGDTVLSMRELVEMIMTHLGRKAWLLNINEQFAVRAVRLLKRLPKFPIDEMQILRLREDKAFDITPARTDLGYAPRDMATGIAQEIAMLRAAGVIK